MNQSQSPRVVVLTGAGISAESGLKTFRDNDGLWEQHRIEDVATPEAFQRNPDLVYRFYNERRAQLVNDRVTPNPAHLALAQLEKRIGSQLLLITQNVDNLHEQAGSKNVLHMHGLLNSARCMKTGHAIPFLDSFDASSPCQCCSPPSSLRPDIVWFGEMPKYMDEIYDALIQADIFISIGTSGNVYPAAGFVQQASDYGAKTLQMNLEETTNNHYFEQHIQGAASKTVPHFVNSFLREHGL